MAIPDYSLGMVQPSQVGQSFSQGLQNGVALGEAAQQSQDRALLLKKQAEADALAKEKLAADAAAKAQQQADFIEVAKAPTTQKISRLIVQYPSMSEQLKRSYDVLDGQEQAAYQSLAQRAYAAASGGNHDTASKILNEAAVAYRNSGMEDRAKALEDNARLIKENPNVATMTLGGFLASTMGPKEFEKTFETAAALPSNVQKKQAEADKAAVDARFANDKALADLGYTKAQANRLYAQTKNDADRLALDREKMIAEQLAEKAKLEAANGKLPETVRKDADAAIRDGTAARLQAQSAEDLAKKFREYDRVGNLSASGARAWLQEGLKNIAGFEDEVSAIRKQHKALTAQLVVTNLPPGAASEKDVELVKGGIPSDTAAPSAIAGFLEASSRVQRAVEQQKRTEAEYLYKNQSLGPARTALVINGVPVRAGESFDEASARVVAAKKPEARTAAANAITDGFNQ